MQTRKALQNVALQHLWNQTQFLLNLQMLQILKSYTNAFFALSI